MFFLKSKKIRLISFLVLSIICFHYFFNFNNPSLSQKKLIPPPQIKNFTFGFSHQIADNLWIRAIQDLDYCEKKIAQNACLNQGWLYKMLSLIVDLSPDFRMPQTAGPLALTVLISDIEGASKLFDRAVENFPNDWPILYRAAYQAMEEEKNYSKAASLLTRAAQAGGAPWFNSLAGRLYTVEGRRDLAEAVYQDISRDPNMKAAAERLRKTIDSRVSKLPSHNSTQK